MYISISQLLPYLHWYTAFFVMLRRKKPARGNYGPCESVRRWRRQALRAARRCKRACVRAKVIFNAERSVAQQMFSTLCGTMRTSRGEEEAASGENGVEKARSRSVVFHSQKANVGAERGEAVALSRLSLGRSAPSFVQRSSPFDRQWRAAAVRTRLAKFKGARRTQRSPTPRCTRCARQPMEMTTGSRLGAHALAAPVIASHRSNGLVPPRALLFNTGTHRFIALSCARVMKDKKSLCAGTHIPLQPSQVSAL